MLPGSLFLEILVAMLTGSVVFLLWRAGRRDRLAEDRGWWPVLAGSGLLFFGTLVDISDHFPGLGQFVILGQTPMQSVAEKMIGFFGGFLLLAIGLFRWLPYVAERRRQAEDLRSKNEDLQEKLRRGSRELALSKLKTAAKLRIHQRQTRQTENLVEAVAANAPIALIATGMRGNISVASGRVLKTLGISDDDTGEPLAELWPMVAEPLSQALEGKRVTTNIAMDSAGMMFQVRCTPWRVDQRQVGAAVVATDITDLVRTQDELRQAKDIAEAASRAKSDFLASMSHELRTPLNSVIGFANLLEKNKNGNLSEQDLRFLERISDNGKHLLALINELLDLSKIEAGQMQVDCRPVELRGLMREVATQMATQAAPEVRLGLKLGIGFSSLDPSTDEVTTTSASGSSSAEDDDSVEIETDPARLRQILVNLTANALKFTHEGQVTLILHQDVDGRPKAIAVRDTGIGIPPKQQGTIFEAFQQVDSGTSRQYTGTGLGLSITRSLCHLLGFELKVESEVGKGSTFTVELNPGTRAEAESRAAESATESI